MKHEIKIKLRAPIRGLFKNIISLIRDLIKKINNIEIKKFLIPFVLKKFVKFKDRI